MTSRVNMYQLNCHHSKDVAAEMRIRMTENPGAIWFLQEPYTYKGKVMGIDRWFYTAFHCANKPRAAIVAPKRYNLLLESEFLDRDIVAVRLTDTGATLVSFYADIGERSLSQKLHNLLEEVTSQRRGSIYIHADSNAHSTIWGCPENNTRGDLWEDLIFRYGLYVMNLGSTPTFVPGGDRRGETIIDITLTDQEGLLRSSDWRVSDTPMYSDHRLITYVYEVDKHLRTKAVWNFHKTDWSSFREILEEELAGETAQKGHDFWTTETIEHENRAITTACLLYTSPSPRDLSTSRMPSSA